MNYRNKQEKMHNNIQIMDVFNPIAGNTMEQATNEREELRKQESMLQNALRHAENDFQKHDIQEQLHRTRSEIRAITDFLANNL